MKVFFDTVGCRLNQSEIEKMAASVRLNGHEVVAEASQADVVIINTCAVTLTAGSDSRSKIRQAARAGCTRVVATGCYATIAPDELLALPGVAGVFPNTEKDELIQKILGEPAPQASDRESMRIPLPGKRHRTRAFIKVQDGCDNFCTFCITRIARGRSRSQPVEEIYRDIESALKGGVKEIVLTGVNLGSWGKDNGVNQTLPYLIRTILRDLSPERLRLSSLEPWDINAEFLDVITLPGFCRHLHLPLQSGSANGLKRMGRRNSPQEFQTLVEKIRSIVPGMAITTDIMVGFPGEDEAEFQESLDFVQRIKLAGGHVFNFSLRPGTPAENLPQQVPFEIRKERSERMRAVIEISRRNYQQKFHGKVDQVLWEQSKQIGNVWQMEGLTDTYIRVTADADSDLQNQFSHVLILDPAGKSMRGSIQVSKK